MNRNAPSLSDFLAVQAVHRAGSFRGAAAELGASTSALSRQISALEEQFGARLFDRDTRNVHTTAAGEAFVRVADRMLDVFDNGMLEFESYLSARYGRLTIAGLPAVTAGLLPALLKDFLPSYPGLTLRIIDVLSEGVLDAVESGVADMGFAAETVSVRNRLSYRRLLDDEFVAVGAPDGPLAEDRPYRWAEIMEMPFVAMAVGTSVRELTDAACARNGLTLAPRCEVTHLATVGAFVSAGLGVSALPTLTLPVVHSETIIQRPIVDFGRRRGIGLVWRSGRSMSPAAQAFLAHIQQNPIFTTPRGKPLP